MHISQFYSCSQIKLACELYYICEIGKYSYLYHGDPVSLSGVVLDLVLQKSSLWQYFGFALGAGWVVDAGVDEFPYMLDVRKHGNYLFGLDKVRGSRGIQDLSEPKKVQAVFSRRDSDAWVYDVGGLTSDERTVGNAALNHNRADQAWLSLVAMVAVNRQYEKEPKKFGVVLDSNILMNDMAFSYIMLLQDETLALKDWFVFTVNESVSNDMQLQIGYTAWYAKGREMGYLSSFYTQKDKLNRLAELDIIPGDLVMLYERHKLQKDNHVKQIASCHLAKIESIKDGRICFDLINTAKPRRQLEEEFNNKTTGVKMLYLGNEPYKKLNHQKRDLDLSDVGVEYCMYGECYFIVPLNECVDDRVVTVGGNSYTVSQNDLVYWILTDFGYEYNKERFLKKFFNEKKPYRDKLQEEGILV